ncbi:molybdopterin molybdotransferase MoeA [Nocardioides salsibiostraticola]
MSQAPIPVEEYRDKILGSIDPMPAFNHPLMDALGLVCAEDVTASIELPRFDNSAMDGYAVRRHDIASATAEAPITMRVTGEIGAGQASEGSETLAPGTVAKIMTGAPVPAGADAVVPYEWTDRGAVDVRIDQVPEIGQHIRPAGQDVRVGDVLIERGTVLGPRHLGLLASVGQASVAAHARPRVVIISTGAELRDPGEQLGRDSIYDGNSYLLAAAVTRAGAVAHRVGIVGDEPAAFLEALHEQVVRADVIVTSGGVSQGDYDVVKAALLPLGTVWFGPVAMQPGKPQGVGRFGDVPIFTLPGNPVSSYISFEVFVRPALRKMMGLTPYSQKPTSARLATAVTSPLGRRQYLRGLLTADGGVSVVAPVGGSGSHLVGDLARANALIVVPDNATSVDAGAMVNVLRLDTEY